MVDERRFDPSEVEEIFRQAAAERRGPEAGASREGLTLTELQAIGAEVGISAARIAEAATALDRSRPQRQRLQVAGIPFGVGRSFALPRAPDDREWGILVAELRETFAAVGKVGDTPGLREWRNGNLHATIEPTAEGYRLRLGTRKSQAAPLGIMAAVWVMIGIGAAFGGDSGGVILGSVLGLGFLSPLARLPRWAALREAQMEEIGRRAVELLGRGAPPPLAAVDPR